MFVDCLEALVETCLPLDNESSDLDGDLNSGINGKNFNLVYQTNSNNNINLSTNSFTNNVSSNYNLIIGSMSSISMSSLHSPVDLSEFNELNRSNNGRLRRNSSPKNFM